MRNASAEIRNISRRCSVKNRCERFDTHPDLPKTANRKIRRNPPTPYEIGGGGQCELNVFSEQVSPRPLRGKEIQTLKTLARRSHGVGHRGESGAV